MIDDKDDHIPSPLTMFTCTALRLALLEWQKHKGVHPKASKSMLNEDRPDRSNYFNCKKGGGMIVSCCALTGRELLTSPGVADTYTFMMNTWNTLPESYLQRVYHNTIATVKRQMQQAENPMPAVVISVEAARVDNAILLGYLISEVVLEDPEIGTTNSNIPIDNHCTDDELHFGMPGCSGDFDDQSDESDAIPTASRRRRASAGLERFDLGTIADDGYEGKDGDDADVDEEKEASQGEDGSTHNVDD